MSSTVMAGLRVLVTRPAHQQQALSEAIEAHGGSVLQRPLINIEALRDDTAKQALRSKIQDLDNYDLLIFVSNNAVRHATQWINDYWPQFPVGVTVLGIGPSTAKLIAVELNCAVHHSPSGMSSEDLLQLPQLREVAGQRVGIFRGQGGRELLAQSLTERGAKVEYLEVYTRSDVSYAAAEFRADLKAFDVNVLTVTSSESLKQLAGLLLSDSKVADNKTADNKANYALLPLLVPSARVAEQARALGFAEVIDIKGAIEASFVAALTALADKTTE